MLLPTLFHCKNTLELNPSRSLQTFISISSTTFARICHVLRLPFPLCSLFIQPAFFIWISIPLSEIPFKEAHRVYHLRKYLSISISVLQFEISLYLETGQVDFSEMSPANIGILWMSKTFQQLEKKTVNSGFSSTRSSVCTLGVIKVSGVLNKE